MFYSVALVAASLIASQMNYFARAAIDEKEQDVAAVFRRMEALVLAFRDEMERVYSYRCDAATLAECYERNFNDCSSSYPNQQCMDANELVVPACGNGISCNALWDKTCSAVRLPGSLADGPAGNPSDAKVIESICYSRLAEQFMVDNRKNGNQIYFGSADGSFRIIPARHSEVCGEYDARRRPWFVAASSGPKDVVLVIDVSGSMDDYRRIDLAKEAAITIIETLTVADRVAVVKFSSYAHLIGGVSRLIRATSENKSKLIDAIKDLKTDGATNFGDAFNTTFNALDNTIRNEATSGCNIAVLFLTDGQITQGLQEDEVVSLVNNRTAQLAEEFSRKTTIFTFSLGYHADHTATKRIACSTGGIWSKVDDFSGDLVKEMSSYYKLYALGLGEGGNEDFTAWVEPYPFSTGGVMGTTVSTPVYDRSVNPPLFLGVAAVDMYMDDIEQIIDQDSSMMLDRFVLLSTAVCPKISFTVDELDALRYIGGGEDAVCQDDFDDVTDFIGILPAECQYESELSKNGNVWQNKNMNGKTYLDRACCEKGGVEPSSMCPVLSGASDAEETDTSPPTDQNSSVSPTDWYSVAPGPVPAKSYESRNSGTIVGTIVVAVVVVFCLGLLRFLCKRNCPIIDTERRISRTPSVIGDGVPMVMPPASAPSFNPEI